MITGASEKLRMWLNAKLRWPRKPNGNEPFPGSVRIAQLMHAEQRSSRKQGLKRRYIEVRHRKAVSKWQVRVLSGSSRSRTHYLLHHFDIIIKAHNKGLTQRFFPPISLPNASRIASCFVWSIQASQSKRALHYPATEGSSPRPYNVVEDAPYELSLSPIPTIPAFVCAHDNLK